MKRSLLALLSIAFAACTSTEEVNCFDTPTSSSCVETCAETTPPGWCECIATPTRDNCETWCDQEGYDNATCRQFQMDGGTDAMDAGDTSDVEVDAGPCGGGCDSGLHCNEETDECVSCLSNAHCDADSQTPICNTSNNTCVGCSNTGDCRTDGGMLFCVEAGRPKAGSCVECLTTENCTGDGEVCHVPGAETTQPNSDGTYACVAAPQVNVCEQCISDDQCAEGFTCAPLTYTDRSNSDMEHPEGYVCLRVADAGTFPCPTSTFAPFVRLREDVNSRNGRSVDVCVLRHSSCQAYHHYGEANSQCSGTNMMDDESCGLEGTTNDAMCEVADQGYLCTMRCESGDDCIAGRSCTGSGCAENSSNCYCAFTGN